MYRETFLATRPHSWSHSTAMTRTRWVTVMGQRKQLRTTMAGMWPNQKPGGTGVRGGGETRITEPARLIQRRFGLAESTTCCHVSLSRGKMLCVSCVDYWAACLSLEFGDRRRASGCHVEPFWNFHLSRLNFDLSELQKAARGTSVCLSCRIHLSPEMLRLMGAVMNGAVKPRNCWAENSHTLKEFMLIHCHLCSSSIS